MDKYEHIAIPAEDGDYVTTGTVEDYDEDWLGDEGESASDWKTRAYWPWLPPKSEKEIEL